MKKNLLWSYVFFVIWGVTAYLLHRLLPISPFILGFSFLFLIFFPGFSLLRLLRFKDSNLLDQIVLSLVLGFVFSLFISAIAVLIHLNIAALLIIYFDLIIVLFLIALIIDFGWKTTDLNLSAVTWRTIFQIQNLIFLIALVFGFLVYLATERAGGFLTGGDAIYHISLIRKAFEFASLSIQNLSYTPGQTEITYLLPVWHVFLALLARIFDLTPFQLWREIAAPLSLLSLLVWFWLFRKILPTRFLAVLALLFLIIFYLRIDGVTLFTTIPIPHSLSQLIFLPLSVGLALKFIFESGTNYKLFILSVVAVLLFALVHLQTLTYYFFLMLIFTLGYAAVNWKQKDYSLTLKKSLMTTFAIAVLLLPVVLFLEFKSQLVSKNMANFAKGLSGRTTYNYNVYSWYALISLPLILLFFKKHRGLIFVIMMMLLTPLIYIPEIKNQLVVWLGAIFTKRLYGNVMWYFMVWALVWGATMTFYDRFLTAIRQKSPLSIYLINVFLVVILVLLIALEPETGLIGYINDKVFGSNTINFLRSYGIYLSLILTVIVIALLIWYKFKNKTWDFFSFSDHKNHLPVFISTLILITVLFLPNYNQNQYFSRIKKKLGFLTRPVVRPIEEKYAINFAGGTETLDFIKNNIPSKSVFEARGGFFYLPAMVDTKMWTYETGAPWAATLLYQKNIPLKAKLNFIKQNQIEYILITNPKAGAKSNFDPYPKNFKNIYQTKKAVIYQIQK